VEPKLRVVDRQDLGTHKPAAAAILSSDRDGKTLVGCRDAETLSWVVV
jgi:hypothetical protein